MTEVNVTKTIQISADKAWANLSYLRVFENISPIERSEVIGEGAGATRTCYMPDGAAIYETLDKVDSSTMEFQYSITEGPFPVEGYVSTVGIKAVGENSCSVSWTAQYDVSDEAAGQMKELFEGFYNVIIDSLENLVKSQN